MKTPIRPTLLRQARRLWLHNDLADQRLNRRNAIEWARKVHALGERWVLHPSNAPKHLEHTP